MADTRISELPAASALATTDVFPVTQSGTTKKATVAQMAAGVGLGNFAIAGPRPYIDVTAPRYGAVPDAVHILGGSISSGSPTLTVTGGALSSADVGKQIVVGGAGASGMPLTTTIAGFTNATTCTLAANASNSVTGAIGRFYRKVTDGAGDGAGTFTSATMTFQASDVGMKLWYNDGTQNGILYTITGFTNSTTVTVSPFFPNTSGKTVHLTRILSDVSTVTTSRGDSSGTVTTTAASGTITVSSGAFTSNDVNSRITLPNAGPGGLDYWGTITGFTNSTTVTVFPTPARTTSASNGFHLYKTTITSATAAFIAGDARTLAAPDTGAGRAIDVYGSAEDGGWQQFEINVVVDGSNVVAREKAITDVSKAPVRYGTDNYTAFTLAVADACSNHSVLFMPPGGYYIKATDANWGFSLTGDVEIRGGGRGCTHLYYENELYTKATSGVFYTGTSGTPNNGPNLVMRDFTFHGSLQTPIGGWNAGGSGANLGSINFLFYNDNLYTTGERRVLIERVDICDRIYGGFYFQGGASTGGGDLQVVIKDCNISAWQQPVTIFSANNKPTRRYLNMKGVRIFNYGQSDGDGAPFGVGVYIHPMVGLRFEQCIFGRNFNYSNTQYAIQHHGTGNWQPPDATIINCVFEPFSNAYETCQSPSGRTVVEGCTFFGHGLEVRSNTIIKACRFLGCYSERGTNPQGVKAISGLGSNHTITIEGCEFCTCGTDIAPQFSATFDVSNTFIKGNATQMIDQSAGAGCNMNLRNVHWIADGDTNRTGSANTNRAIVCNVAANRLTVQNCTIEGPYQTGTGGGALRIANLTTGTVEGVDFLNSAGIGLVVTVNASGKVFHRNNNYLVSGSEPQTDAASTVAAGTIRNGIQTVIASAATISPDCSGDVVHITGTTQITRIRLKGADGTAAAFHGAKLYLIWDNATPGGLGTGGTTPGGIAVAVTAVQNTVTELIFDTSTGLWYPVQKIS